MNMEEEGGEEFLFNSFYSYGINIYKHDLPDIMINEERIPQVLVNFAVLVKKKFVTH